MNYVNNIQKFEINSLFYLDDYFMKKYYQYYTDYHMLI